MPVAIYTPPSGKRAARDRFRCPKPSLCHLKTCMTRRTHHRREESVCTPGRAVSRAASGALRRTAHAVICEPLEDRRYFAFGVTSTTGGLASWVIDNGQNLKFSVLRPGATNISSTVHIGDIISIKYKNQE